MGKTLRQYTGEFKEQALKLSDEIGAAKASEKLGVSINTLYGWKSRRKDPSAHIRGLKPNETLEEGFRRVEQEASELREANQILKKAMGFLVGR